MFHVSSFMKEKGITLVEILVVIFIIALFSGILVSDFPKIRRRFSLTRATYKLAQDLKRVQDMGFSGVRLKDSLVRAKGYGIYIDLKALGNKEYLMYADTTEPADQKYTSGEDYIIETTDFSTTEKEVIIKEIKNTDNYNQWVIINFKPPNPDIEITKLASGMNRVEITLALENDSDPLNTKSVFVYTSGLIETK